ncbi:hypothetical protein IDJ77_16300 [Mucilaginibacter sp. ZT4R22]|uniref:MACPF domain-containing protein n=1 Tax=Mucilaginibacter pankratovii TaxID=2772110 RepID=A0ABR7WSZ2_9SPHI|nr:MAC/perforin domain-containing protein [Mucilaginibacter pankratovii]MBD1365376.1 hypothetical protein [Mucilaginibacter pankratovii]
MKNSIPSISLKGVYAIFLQLFLLILLPAGFTGCKKVIENPNTPGNTPSTNTGSTVTVPNLYMLGKGYDITGYYADKASVRAAVIDNNRFYKDYINRVIDEAMLEQGNTMIAGENISSYTRNISGKLKVSGSLGLFKSSVSYFDSVSFRSDFVYAGYNFYIKRKHLKYNATAELLKKYINSEFKEDLATLTPAQIVKAYGTSVIVDVLLGARFEALYRARTTSSDRKTAASAGLSFAVEKLFDFKASGSYNSTAYQYNQEQQLAYKAIGGDPSVSLTGTINLGPTLPPQISTESWQRSVSTTNIEMIDWGTDESLINLADLVDDRTKSDALRAYIAQYLADRQVKMVDGPTQIYQYQDFSTSAIAYSSQNEPSIYGRFTLQGPAFRAYAKQVDGTEPVYGWYNPSRGDFTYSRATSVAGATNFGVCFYAYPNSSVPGTIPVYEYSYNAKIHKQWYYSHLYSTSNQKPQGNDWAYTGVIPFYTFSL